MNSFGFTIFQNAGLVAVIYIFIPKWARGEYLDNSNSFSTLAMIFYIFLTVNNLAYFAMTNIQTFFAVLDRMSIVFRMEEYKKERE
jgi:hypothetical protein